MLIQITLTKRIYLIDCPGVVPPNANDSAEDILLRGVVRVEAVENPAQYIEAALKRVQRRHLDRTYGITENYTTSDEFLEILARKRGKLHKANVPDFDGIAVTVLREFLRGKIPWYVPPPDWEGRDSTDSKISGREGRLGEMAGKRKREDDETAEKTLQAAKKVAQEKDENEEDDDDDDDEFEGFEGTGVVLPGTIGDLSHFEENDAEDDDDDEAEDDDEEEALPTPAVGKAGSKPPAGNEDTGPPGKKRRKD